MHLTPTGIKSAKLDEKERKALGLRIVKGDDIIKYVQRPVCYEAAAYVRFLLGTTIDAAEVAKIKGKAWELKLALKAGTAWNGSAAVPPGVALGFFRQRDQKFFHAAVSAGGTLVRAVNGGPLGTTWIKPVDLKHVLGKPGSDGWFDFGPTKIKVYVARV